MITVDQLRAEGYEPRAPDGATFIDNGVASESHCSECGHLGLDYEGWQRGKSYRAVAVCPECGYREEF